MTFGNKRIESILLFFLFDCINIYIVNRGNVMGDAGVRALTHILQTNRHLHTIYFDRNFLSLNNFEEIVNAMEEYVYRRKFISIDIFDLEIRLSNIYQYQLWI